MHDSTHKSHFLGPSSQHQLSLTHFQLTCPTDFNLVRSKMVLQIQSLPYILTQIFFSAFFISKNITTLITSHKPQICGSSLAISFPLPLHPMGYQFYHLTIQWYADECLTISSPGKKAPTYNTCLFL